jgi:hypothetical protein
VRLNLVEDIRVAVLSVDRESEVDSEVAHATMTIE